ncbi:hypothetical protein SUGI_0366550 [Cryptomeria japonica]|nr:hypothetical protein SUGI_0366550 [Cryptomeria japonica]
MGGRNRLLPVAIGIACNTTTGLVTSVDLSGDWHLNGTANMATISNLSNLEHLDLSWNDFDSAVIIPKIGRLTNLAYLDLSTAGFSGKIPAELGNLTRLTTLHLSNNYRPSGSYTEVRGFLKIDNVNWLRRLAVLRSLFLDGVHLSGAKKEWGPAVSSLRQLARLSMVQCDLFPFLPAESNSLRNLSPSLQYLDPSGNGDRKFTAQFPTWLKNFTALRTLDLSSCALSGNIFPIQNLQLRKLELFSNNLSGDVSFIFSNQSIFSWLSLPDNGFGGTIPVNISPPSLTHLDLSGNNLGGSVPETIARLVKLQDLILGYNNFSGQIPISLSQLLSLTFLDLGMNRFSGGIPSNLGDLPNLKYLELSQNQLNGSIPPSFGRLSGLKHLNLSYNKLTEAVKLEAFENLTGLQFFALSRNKLTLNFSSVWNPSFRLRDLRLSGCDIKGAIPPFLSQQLDLQDMDLSNNNLTGNIPSGLWELPTLGELNLSGNHLEGYLPGYLFAKREEGYLPVYSIDLHSKVIFRLLLQY